MAASDTKFAEDISPSIKISAVFSILKDSYFGKGPVTIDKPFLDELTKKLERKTDEKFSDEFKREQEIKVQQRGYFFDWNIFQWLFQWFLKSFTELPKMASDESDTEFEEDFSPKVRISDVISRIENLYYGKEPVIIDENFLDALKRENLPLPNEILTKIFSYLLLEVRFCQKILMFHRS